MEEGRGGGGGGKEINTMGLRIESKVKNNIKKKERKRLGSRIFACTLYERSSH